MPGVADYLISRMLGAGIRALFGLPGGGGNLGLIEAAGRAGLPFVLTATETGSAIAAIAQSEVTGTPGACITTLGPGAASVVNGVACAKLERAPVLVITDSHAAGSTYEHQRLDHQALLAPVVKWSGSLAPPNATQNIDNAFARLGEIPSGPVHLDCPAGFETGFLTGSLGAQGFAWNEEVAGPEFQELLSVSRKPLLILGLGARRPEVVEAVRALCEKCGVPALVTYKAKGALPDSHPWFAGVFTHGAIEGDFINECDLIIGIGLDPVEILPRPWTYPQPVVSIAPWEVTTDHVPFRIQQIGHVDLAVDTVARKLAGSTWNQSAVRAQVDSATLAVRRAGSKELASLTAQDVVVEAAARFAGRARVTVDAGAHMFAATVLWPVSEPNELLISNGLSTMGFAVPAAVGAAVADPSKPVVAITGDGGLLICMGELATLARERLKVVVLVLNDASLSLIEIKQQARELTPAGVALGDLRWTKIAEGFGIPTWSASTIAELDRALQSAAAVDGPALVEARIDRSNYGETMRIIRG